MQQGLTAPTARERAAFDAATTATPKEFVSTCRVAGLDPSRMLDAFDAAPWRWLFNFSDPLTDEVRHRPFQPAMRERLDAAREYVDASWWRRLFAPQPSSEEIVGRRYTGTRQHSR